MKKRQKRLHIGTSGWSYDHWKENFFPKDLNSNDWLRFYSEHFLTVEINSTFYHTPKEKTVLNWCEKVKKDFVFSVKINRYITHNKKLNDCKNSLDIFYKSIHPFKKKMGPILIQLPPKFYINQERLIEFIDLLDKKYRYVFEFRHDSWFTSEIYSILTENNIALCLTDLNGKLSPEVITADFIYIRLHGPKNAYTGSYGTKKLNNWKVKIEAWLKNYNVFCYFDNDEKGYAIQDALFLNKILTLSKI